MSITLTRSAPVLAISPDLAAVCLFALLGLMLSLAVLLLASSETIFITSSIPG